jgi:hypothetical protein
MLGKAQNHIPANIIQADNKNRPPPSPYRMGTKTPEVLFSNEISTTFPPNGNSVKLFVEKVIHKPYTTGWFPANQTSRCAAD